MGDTMISVSLAGVVSYLDPANPAKPKEQRFGHSSMVSALAYDSADNAFYSGDASGFVVRWDAASAATSPLRAHTNQVKRIAVDGDTIVSTAMDATVRFATRGANGAYDASVSTDGLPSDVAAVKGVVVVATNKAVQL